MWFRSLAIWLICLTLPLSAAAETLRVTTPDWPPYASTDLYNLGVSVVLVGMPCPGP